MEYLALFLLGVAYGAMAEAYMAGVSYRLRFYRKRG
jgi:hypothetical protein